jgi:hypothetical protein
MSKLVCHMQKVKSAPVMNSIGEENDREKKEEIEKQRRRNSTIDGTKTAQNFDALDGIEHDKKMSERVDDVIKKGYNSKRKIRNDAVKMIDGVIGSDAEFFAGMDLQKRKQFATDCAAFLVQKVGRENIVGCRWHNDEVPPHLHFQFVPLKDGKLNVKECGFTKVGLQVWHSELANFLHQRGWKIERGTVRQEWEKPVQHLQPNEYKRKHYSVDVPSVKLEKILHQIDGRVDISTSFFSKNETAKMDSNDYKILRDIAGEVVTLRRRVEELEPLEKEIEKMRKSYAGKKKNLAVKDNELDRQLEQVKNKNEQEKYKRMQVDLQDNVARVKQKEKEIDATLRQIRQNQRDGIDIANGLIDKAMDEPRKRLAITTTLIDNGIAWLRQHDKDVYDRILAIGRRESMAAEHDEVMERRRQNKKGYSR